MGWDLRDDGDQSRFTELDPQISNPRVVKPESYAAQIGRESTQRPQSWVWHSF